MLRARRARPRIPGSPHPPNPVSVFRASRPPSSGAAPTVHRAAPRDPRPAPRISTSCTPPSTQRSEPQSGGAQHGDAGALREHLHGPARRGARGVAAERKHPRHLRRQRQRDPARRSPRRAAAQHRVRGLHIPHRMGRERRHARHRAEGVAARAPVERLAEDRRVPHDRPPRRDPRAVEQDVAAARPRQQQGVPHALRRDAAAQDSSVRQEP